MSILIKGMEMPKDIEPGLVIEFSDGIDGKRYARLYHYRHGGLTEWLEAVPVPPYGRLGDLDKAYKDALTQVSLAFASHNKEQAAMAVANVISNAPTIIPADHFRDDPKLQEEVNTDVK